MNSSRRIAVIGATGQLGADLVKAIERRAPEMTAIPLDHTQVDVTSLDSLERRFAGEDFDFVVNTAAFHDVDQCEREPHVAFDVNTIGAQNVAKAARQVGAYVVYISTDYVFSGARPDAYDEDDMPSPVNMYGVTKLGGEQLTLASTDSSLVVRVSSLFGKHPPRGKARNFVEAILEKAARGEAVRVVDDIGMTPTYTHDAAETIVSLLDQGATGVVHGANRGQCTWFEFALYVLRAAGSETKPEPVPASTWPSLAHRPSNSALTSRRLPAAGLGTRPWQEAVDAYLEETSLRRTRQDS